MRKNRESKYAYKNYIFFAIVFAFLFVFIYVFANTVKVSKAELKVDCNQKVVLNEDGRYEKSINRKIEKEIKQIKTEELGTQSDMQYNIEEDDELCANYISSAKSMVLMDKCTNQVLSQYQKDKKLPIASTTKIVTAITVLDNEKNIEKVIKIPKEAVGIEGSSIYLKEGEEWSLKDLLAGLMLRSGNDAATALAISVGGSVENFAKMMNETAARLGATNSNFVNPHGLNHDEHYSTAHDLAVITAYALKNNLFKEIVSSKKINATNGQVFYNKNKMLNMMKGATGVKTGYTKVAGRCLVSSAEKDGMELVCVVLDCGPMFEVSKSLLESGLENFELKTVVKKEKVVAKVKIKDLINRMVKVYTKEDICVNLPVNKKSEITTELILPDSVDAPIKKDTIIGKMKIKLNGVLFAEKNLYVMEDVSALDFFDILKIVTDKF